MLGLVGLSGCGGPSGEQARPLRVQAVIGEVGSQPGQFSYPRAMDCDGNSLWVIDKLARVQRLDAVSTPPGKVRSGWRMPDFLAGKPVGVTVWRPADATSDRDTLIFVPDTHYYRVMVYRPGEDGTSTNEPVLTFGRFGHGSGEFTYATDVAVLATADGSKIDRIYVSEYGGYDRVSIFAIEGGIASVGAWPRSDACVREGETAAVGEPARVKFLKSFGVFGSGPGVEFNRPQSLAIDETRRELIVVDACNHRVGRFTLEGELITWIGGVSNAAAANAARSGVFNYPYGIELLDDGTALIAENGGSRVTQIALDDGKVLQRFGGPGRNAGELANPWAVSIVGQTAFVLDSQNNRVQAFAAPAERARMANGNRGQP